MKNQKKKTFKLDEITKDKKQLNSIIETALDTERIVQIIEDNFYEQKMQGADNSDVDINHLEKIFTNETYYLAMKIVPLLERKVLYLSFIENARLDNICKRLKLQKKQVISLRSKGIMHFKNNLNTLYKANNINNKGSDSKWSKIL